MHCNGLKACLVTALAVVAGVLTPQDASAESARRRWIPAWATAPSAPITALPVRFMPRPLTLKGTIRYHLRLNAGGTRLALRLSNETGAEPLVIDNVTVATAAAPMRAVPVRFGTSSSVEIQPGAPAQSDPIDLKVTAGEQIVASVHLVRSYVATQGQYPNRTEYLADVGGAPGTPPPLVTSIAVRPIISAVVVSDGPSKGAIVAFGDSITDGVGGRQPFVRGWPDVLAKRLNTSRAASGMSVVNAGIGGNRLLATTPWGAAALARFDRDVLSLPNVKFVVVLEGINDIGGLAEPPNAPAVTADRITAVYRQIIARARQHGIKVIGGTLPPFGGAFYFTPAKEVIRRQVNDWIRTSGAFDGVADFDAALRDPASPDRLLAAYDTGDHLHPGDEGYRAMGEAIDLRMFR